ELAARLERDSRPTRQGPEPIRKGHELVEIDYMPGVGAVVHVPFALEADQALVDSREGRLSYPVPGRLDGEWKRETGHAVQSCVPIGRTTRRDSTTRQRRRRPHSGVRRMQ